MKKIFLILFLISSCITIANDSTYISKSEFKSLKEKVESTNTDIFYEHENSLIKDVYGKMLDTIGISVSIAALIMTGLSIFCAVLYKKTDDKINKNIESAKNTKEELKTYKALANELKDSNDIVTQKLKLLYNEVEAQKILLYAERLRRESKFNRAYEKVREGINFIEKNKLGSDSKSMLLSFTYEKANINLAKFNYKEALDCFIEIHNLDPDEERPILQICEASLFSYNFESYITWAKKIDERRRKYELEYFNCFYLFLSEQYEDFDNKVNKLRMAFPHLDSYLDIDWDFKDFNSFINKHRPAKADVSGKDSEYNKIYNRCLNRMIDLVNNFQQRS